MSLIDSRTRTNHEENCKLIVMRETLIPKLKFVEVDVSEVEN